MSFFTVFAPLVLGLPWLLFLPGYLTQLWFVTRRSRPHPQDGLETAFISTLVSLCLTGWLALVLVELGWFSLPRLLLLVLAYCLVLGWLVKRPGLKDAQRGLWGRGDPWTWLLLGVTLVAALLYFFPHEYVLGGSDAGVYVSLGGHIARSGGLLFEDPELAALAPGDYPALFRPQPDYLIPRYIQFPGFYLSDDQAGLVIPQFYPLHPVWLAIFNSLGGVRASLYAAPLWGTLGCLAVGLTATRLFGRRTGGLAALLLAVSATQIWFARYPTSETLTQFLLFGGIYAFSRYMADEAPLMGLLAGLSLGLVMLARVDVYFLLAIPVLLVAYLRLTRQLGRRHLIFLGPFLALGLHSLLHGFFQSWPYLYNTVNWQLTLLPLSALAAFGGILVVGYLLLDLWTGGRAERLARLARWVGRGATLLAALTVLLAIYAYFVRPRQADLSIEIYYWYADHPIPYVEPDNLPRLGWYLSPLGIALAVLGVWWMLRRDLSRQSACFLGVGLFFSFLFIQSSRNNPHHIYVMRRYVPAVIPTFSIAAAYALARGWQRQDRWRWLVGVAAVVQVALLIYAARIVVRQVDYRGALAQLAPWAAALDSNAVILFDDDGAISTGATVGTPLRYLFGHTVFDLQETYSSPETLDRLVRGWQAQGWPVLLAVGPNGVREPFADWPLTPLPGLWLDTTILEMTYQHFPRQILGVSVAVELYEVAPVASRAAGSFRIDVGASDFFYLGVGWYGKERLPDGRTIRWTSQTARLTLPAWVGGDEDLQISLGLAAAAPAGQVPVQVRLRYCANVKNCDAVTGTAVGARWQVGTSFEVYQVTLPASVLPDGPLSLWLESATWNPAALGLSADARDLGVMVDWISVE